MLKLMGKKILTILHSKMCLSETVLFSSIIFQMINGGPLPKFEIHTPSSSFDAQGGFNSAIDLPGRV